MWPYTKQPSNRPSAPHWSQCLIPHFLASLGAQEQLDIALIFPHFAHQCCDHLTAVKTGCPLTSITWPYRGLRCWPIEVKYFFEGIRWQVTSFQMIAGSCLIFFFIDMKDVLFLGRTIKILILNWPRTRKFSQLLQAIQLLLTLLTMVTRWSRSTSLFYALIGQNLTGKLMRKIYAASWILFTLTAEAERVLCQLVMFLTVFFHWMHKMKFSCYQEPSVIHG